MNNKILTTKDILNMSTEQILKYMNEGYILDLGVETKNDGCVSCGNGYKTITLGIPTCPGTVNPKTVVVTPSATGGVLPYVYTLKVTDPNAVVTYPTYTSPTFNVLMKTPGSWALHLTATDVNGCPSDTADCSVVILAIPKCDIVPFLMTLTSSDKIAPGSVTVNVTYINNGASSITFAGGASFGLIWINNTQYKMIFSNIMPVTLLSLGTKTISLNVSGLDAGTYYIKPEIPDSIITGACTITSPIYGDLDQNGAVDASDKTILNNIIAGTITPTPCQKALADLNRDGILNSTIDGNILTGYLNNTLTGNDKLWVGRSVATLDSQSIIIEPCPSIITNFTAV